MALKIPEKHREILLAYSQLSQEIRTGFLEYLTDSENVLNVSLENVAKELKNKFPEIKLSFENLLEVFLSINRSKIFLEQEIEEFADEILESLLIAKIRLENEIKSDLIQILNSPLSVIAKLTLLFFENEKVITDVDIFSDFRPIIESNLESKISHGIILHTLKLKFKDSQNNENTFYATLQPELLKDLKGIFEKAEKNEKIMKDSLSDIKLIDLKD